MNRPQFTLIAGANGSGKSTLTRNNPEIFAAFPTLDPDAIAKTLQMTVPTASTLTAGRQALRIARQQLQARMSFAVETTLSGKNYLRMMLDARARGFDVVLVYIGTESVEINLARIAGRVLSGGHDVEETDVLRRYARSLRNAPAAISRADHVILFDNSSEQGYQLVSVIDQRQSTWFEPLPKWAVALRRQLS